MRGLGRSGESHLSKAGVAPRVAMATMRHSSLDLTKNIYTDPVLLSIGAAVEALPMFDDPRRTVGGQGLISGGRDLDHFRIHRKLVLTILRLC